MGIYLNPKAEDYNDLKNSTTFVDKSLLISFTNSQLKTDGKRIASFRPRRFGKTLAAKMLLCYYCKAYDSHEIFKNLNISKDPSYEKYINKFDVLFLDIKELMQKAYDNNESDFLSFINKEVINELRQAFPNIIENSEKSLSNALAKINIATDNQFVIIIDEWDAFFRERKEDTKLQENYINFLYNLFKAPAATNFTALAYLTGILPIKKYNVQSKLNNFDEYTMLDPKKLASVVGFTDNEVKELCKKFNMNFNMMEQWYDGYCFYNKSVHKTTDKPIKSYCPNSVVKSLKNSDFSSYWTQTESFESLLLPISLNFDGLKEDIIKLIEGESIEVDPLRFQNDMTSFQSKDDVLTLLVHLGYLAYNSLDSTVRIPNHEIRDEFRRTVLMSDKYSDVFDALTNSEKLLKATLNKDSNYVANILDEIHQKETSIINYNNENALASVISLAYFTAQNEYYRFRENPAGKGRADIIYVPKPGIDKPALVIELKWNKSTKGAIDQIKEKQYDKALDDFTGNILLVGINYDKSSKKHECQIEEYKK